MCPKGSEKPKQNRCFVGTCEAVRDSGIVSVSVGDTVAGSDTVSDFLGVTVGDGLGVRTIVELGVNRPVAEALRLGVSSPLGDTLAARLTLRDTDVLTLSEPEEVASAVCDGECDWLTRGDFVVETRTLLEILTSLVAVHAPDPGSACSFGLQATHADCDVLPSLGLYVFAGQRVQPCAAKSSSKRSLLARRATRGSVMRAVEPLQARIAGCAILVVRARRAAHARWS